MSKLGKTSFERIEKDFYPTGIKPLEVLEYHLPQNLTYCEPCAGAFDLIDNLEKIRKDIKCNASFDIIPRDNRVTKKSALDITPNDVSDCYCFITNPPYKWEMFNPITEHLLSIKPVWYLIPADFMHNKRMIPFMKKCSKIVSVGRVKWFENTGASSTDNFCWYFFETSEVLRTEFHHRI